LPHRDIIASRSADIGIDRTFHIDHQHSPAGQVDLEIRALLAAIIGLTELRSVAIEASVDDPDEWEVGGAALSLLVTKAAWFWASSGNVGGFSERLRRLISCCSHSYRLTTAFAQ
jgi:hypothetical protein